MKNQNFLPIFMMGKFVEGFRMLAKNCKEWLQ
jgi:hypothetical protein